MRSVMIFSGTTEGRRLAMALAGKLDVHVRVATEYGEQVMGSADGIDVKAGSCGGPEGIAAAIKEAGCGLVVDATHPYAVGITGHIREGCAKTGTEYVRLKRDESSEDTSDMVRVASLEDAIEYLKGTEGPILATTGSNGIGLYAAIPGYRERVTARVLSTPDSVTKCAEYGFSGKNLIAAQGPFSEEMDLAMLKQTGARYLVTKDSGAPGGYGAKVRAARRAGATVVLIERPGEDGLSFAQVLSLIEDRFGIKAEDAAAKRTVNIIGTGMGRNGCTVSAMDRIRGSDVVIGAKRMIETVGFGGPSLEEYRSGEIISFLDAHPEYATASVLMSGDVGFYSGARKLLEGIDRGRYDVVVEPGVSSAAYLCDRMGIPWQDVCLTSAHGRGNNIVGL